MKNQAIFLALILGYVFPVGAGRLPPSADPRIGMLELRVWELTLETNVNRQVHSLDWNQNDQYKAASTRGAFSKQEEDGRPFLRIGEKGNAFAHGVRPTKPYPVQPGFGYTLTIDGRGPKGRYLVYLQMFDATGKNISARLPEPAGWTYTKWNTAFYRLGKPANGKWQTEELSFTVPDGVAHVLPVLATWVDGTVPYFDCCSFSMAADATRVVNVEIPLRRKDDANGWFLENEAAALQVQASLTLEDSGMTTVKAVVSDLSNPPRPRALQVAVEWPQNLTGWTWHRDWRSDERILEGTEFSNRKMVTGIPVGIYPFSAVSKNGEGLAVGTALDDPAFECGTVTAHGIRSTRAVGLLKRGERGSSAELSWLVFPFKGTWGFRSAAQAYYASQAKKIPQVKARDFEGTRAYLGVQASQLPEHVEDFGLAYYIPNGSAKERALAREKGMLVHPYILAWQIPTHHYVDYDRMPPMEDRLAELRSWLPITNEKGHRNFKSKSALAKVVLGSMPTQADGTHPLSLEWYDGVVHYWRLNVDPRLPSPSAASTFREQIEMWGLDTIDGVYLDNVYIQDFNNVRPDHLAVMDEPLVYDFKTARPCAHAMQHQVAFVKMLGDWLHPLGKRVTGNVFPGGTYRFNATLLDVFGCEVGCFGHGGEKRSEKLRDLYDDAAACERRFYAYHRPVADMLQDGNWTKPVPAITAAGITNYVDHHMFYGFYPSVVTIGGEDFPGYRGWKRYFGPSRQCARDRELFKTAIPLIRRLNQAGWQPETGVRSNHAKILVERFGTRDSQERFITVRNAADAARDVVLTCDKVFPAMSLHPVWHGSADVLPQNGQFKFRLEGWTTVVFQVQ